MKILIAVGLCIIIPVGIVACFLSLWSVPHDPR